MTMLKTSILFNMKILKNMLNSDDYYSANINCEEDAYEDLLCCASAHGARGWESHSWHARESEV